MGTVRWYNDPNNADAAAYRKKNGIAEPGGGTTPPKSGAKTPEAKPQTPQQTLDSVIKNAGDWNTRANNIATASQDYGKNNPFSKDAADYNKDILAGDTSRNPFMGELQGDLNGVNMNESFDLLRQFLGGGAGIPGKGSGAGGNNVRYVGDGVHGSGGSIAQSQGGGAGQVPDTVGNSTSFFAQHIKDLFDPSRLDPAHDPTMQPYLDMLSRKSNEALMGQLQDVSARAEGSGMYGSGLYQAMDRQARGTSQQALSDSITQALMGARSEALQNQMGGLGLTNQRDIAAMNDATQRYGIDSASSSSGAGAAAAAADAEQGRRLQAISMMMQGGQYGLGLKNDLAGNMSNAQQGALNAGIGYGNLGMSGYNTAISAGGMGQNALGLQGQIANANRQNQQQQANQGYNRKFQEANYAQNSLQDYLNMLMGIGGMGGAGYGTQTSPGQYVPTTNPIANALMGGVGGYNSYQGGQ